MPESGGELLLGDSLYDPFCAILEPVLGQMDSSQLILHTLEQEEVIWSEVRREEWV